jgi:peptidoglycan L-alanyl-D-glutamate endopeptidase CwlK
VASRSLDDLAPPVKLAALSFLKAAGLAGLDVLIYCTSRPLAEQASLYAQGRTKPGRIVTAAKPGESRHNPDASGKAWAFDAVPMVNGRAMFHDALLVDRMGEIGESVGLEWAGRWTGRMRERVHFQIKKEST